MFVPLYYTHTVERDGIHRFIFTFLSQVKLICYLWVHKGRSKMYLGFEVRKKMLLLHEKFLLHYDRLHQVTRNTNVFVTWLFFVIHFPARISNTYFKWMLLLNEKFVLHYDIEIGNYHSGKNLTIYQLHQWQNAAK